MASARGRLVQVTLVFLIAVLVGGSPAGHATHWGDHWDCQTTNGYAGKTKEKATPLTFPIEDCVGFAETPGSNWADWYKFPNPPGADMNVAFRHDARTVGCVEFMGDDMRTQSQCGRIVLTARAGSAREHFLAFFNQQVPTGVLGGYTFSVWLRAPVMELFSCTPEGPVRPGDTLTCSFRARDQDGDQLRYGLRDGGGQWYRVPPSGTVPPNETFTASVTAQGEGMKTFAVVALDSPKSQRSNTFTQTRVVTSNDPPVIEAFGCTPEGATVRTEVECSIRASDDDSDRVYYVVDWGAGEGVERVPPSGWARPNEDTVVRHTWTRAGDRTVRVVAMDDGLAFTESAPRTFHQEIRFLEAEVNGRMHYSYTTTHGFGDEYYAINTMKVFGSTQGLNGRSFVRLTTAMLGNEAVKLEWEGSADLDVRFFERATSHPFPQLIAGRHIPHDGCRTDGSGTSETCTAPAGAYWALVEWQRDAWVRTDQVPFTLMHQYQ